jgi:LysR family hydrogen peroxide-inducible transcriptional activator
MNLRDLHYVLAVAELGHFGRAAEACHVSQPTLSGQILKLEDELGVKIFERVGRRIRPTPVGEQILVHAREAVAAADDITVLARANRDPLAGPLRLGVIPTLAPYLMPFVLPIASQALPAAPLMLYEDLTANLVAALAEGRLDAAVIASDPEDHRLGQHLLFDEPFYVAMPPDHPLAAKKRIRAEDLDPKTLLLLADGHCLRDQAIEFCGHEERSATGADIRATSLETLLHLTAAHYGVTLVPRLAVGIDIGAIGRLIARPLDGPKHFRRVRLIHRRNTPREEALTVLAEMIRDGVPEGVERLDD